MTDDEGIEFDPIEEMINIIDFLGIPEAPWPYLSALLGAAEHKDRNEVPVFWGTFQRYLDRQV